MLRYCGWCGKFQGSVKASGYQVRKNLCAIETTTICPACFQMLTKELSEAQHLQHLRA